MPQSLVLLAMIAAVGDPPTGGDEFFEATIRPILVERCQKCHGDDAKPKGGLRLTSRAAVLKGGDTGPSAVSGKPGESPIVAAVRYLDEPKMPPKAKLPDAEVAALAKWVEMGMPWPGSDARADGPPAPSSTNATPEAIAAARRTWTFRAPEKPPIPVVSNPSWATSEIDKFILAKLDANGLEPAPRADERTLIRRATFDLIGLPPSPREVADFLADDSPEAFAKVVDRLLASPGYGERWGRRWLDVVRYADSLDNRGSGGPGDILDAWRYRDWVVSALNKDMPYDQFARDQIAGDLLPPDSASTDSDGFNREGTIATTMLAIGNWGNGDADKEKVVTDIADDQVDVVSKAFLGLTVACARCHDHKFDPISQADYYGLAGMFFSTRILEKIADKGAGEGIIRVPLASRAELERRAARDRRIAELGKSLDEMRKSAYAALASEMKPQAGQYLLAAHDYRSKPDAGTLPEFAASRGLMPFALRQWVQAVGGDEPRTLPTKVQNIGGIAGIVAWYGPAGWASATANTTPETHQVQTFRLPARSISVHPGPASAAVVSWSSPIAGKVRISGRVADNDPACGNGVSWSLQHRAASGVVEIASGDLGNGAQMALGQAKDGEKLASIAVAKGDRIDLVIAPKGEYACDTTTIDLLISEWDGPATWDVTRDCLDTFLAANPHADRSGHEEVWRFADAPNPSEPGGAMASALAGWRSAVAGGADRATLETVAETLAGAFPLDDESSPFRINDPADEVALSPAARASLEASTAELAKLRADAPPPIEFANAAQDGGVPNGSHPGTHDVRIHHRGRYDKLGDLVPRRFPIVLAGDDQPAITDGSGRLDLARWISRPENPLFARVMVNRLWQGHFGEALARTPSNFGRLGGNPSHPELLDWLAVRLVESGWSLKAIHRAIMLSSTYQQSSTPSADGLRIDGDNRWLSHQNRRRLESETIRDNLVSASGEMDPRMGGPADRDANTLRRGLYVITIRSDRSTPAALFDQADSTAPADHRNESTVAPQSLYLMNNSFVVKRAEVLAKRLLAEAGDDRSRIARSYEILFARAPTTEEVQVGLEMVAGGENSWASYCHVLLCTNEFLYID